MLFARKFGNKYGKKLMDTATKSWIDAEKAASKRIVQKTAEVTGDFIGNKIAHKLTSIGKPKEKEAKEKEKVYIPPEKSQQIIDDLRLFWKMWHYYMRMGFQKILNFLYTTFDNNKDLPKFVTKDWIEVYDLRWHVSGKFFSFIMTPY